MRTSPLLSDDEDCVDELHQRLIRDLDDQAMRRLPPDQRRELVERAARDVAAFALPHLVGDVKEEVVTRVVDEITASVQALLDERSETSDTTLFHFLAESRRLPSVQDQAKLLRERFLVLERKS